MMEKYSANCCFNEKEIFQNYTAIDEQLITDSLNSFVKMDLLEKVED